MKLSDNTVEILRNFASINQDIIVKPGSKLRTISQAGSVYAEATVEEEFPIQFGIYKMKRFLDAINLIDGPELVFGETAVTMQGNSSAVSFTYADPSIIIAPPDRELKPGTPDVVFKVAQDDFNRVLKASMAMELPDVSFVCADGKLSFVARNKASSSSDTFDFDIGQVDCVDFCIDFKSENLRLFPADYTVNITGSGARKAAMFVSERITYLVAAELTSTYG